MNVAMCIGCGCDDHNACFDEITEDACHWIRIDRDSELGVCSTCYDHQERWDKGDRAIAVPVQ